MDDVLLIGTNHEMLRAVAGDVGNRFEVCVKEYVDKDLEMVCEMEGNPVVIHSSSALHPILQQLHIDSYRSA